MSPLSVFFLVYNHQHGLVETRLRNIREKNAISISLGREREKESRQIIRQQLPSVKRQYQDNGQDEEPYFGRARKRRPTRTTRILSHWRDRSLSSLAFNCLANKGNRRYGMTAKEDYQALCVNKSNLEPVIVRGLIEDIVARKKRKQSANNVRFPISRLGNRRGPSESRGNVQRWPREEMLTRQTITWGHCCAVAYHNLHASGEESKAEQAANKSQNEDHHRIVK